ncbi:unnamed protein product [Durusdinium trenchii]|uniref:C3H1-type domain-containing protein n=1 Tax=Durusdinium trenchii TaxID=1381693 RepID=A0ABP0QUK5_9DINO
MEPPTKRSRWDAGADIAPPEMAQSFDARSLGSVGLFDGAPQSLASSSAAGYAAGYGGYEGCGGYGGFGGCDGSGCGGSCSGCGCGGGSSCSGCGCDGCGCSGGSCGGCGWDPSWQPSAASGAMPAMAAAMPEVKVIQIPAKQKGGLIGVGGEAIARIRQASGASIKIDHQGGDYLATITISGNVAVAEQLINERLNEQYHPRDGWASKVVDVDPAMVGHIIGPGGANLRHIFDTTGCKIKFIQATEVDPMAMPGKQVACVRGPPDRLWEGEEALVKKIRDIESKKAAPAPVASPGRPLGLGGYAPSGHASPALGNSPGGKGMAKGLGGYLSRPTENQWTGSRSDRGPPPPVRGGKVIPCRFHLKNPGMCKNREACPFSHDASVIAAALGIAAPMINPNAPTYKTTMCRYFDLGQCARGASCSYAHGEQELRIGLTAAQQNAGGVKRVFSEAAPL